jgi:SAM-dependent methyltransferase
MDAADRHRTIRDHYEKVWSQGDAWAFDSSPYEMARFDHLAGVLGDRHYRRGVEIGCGAGAFTLRLRPLVDDLLALDVAEAAITRARDRVAAGGGGGGVRFLAANAMEHDFAADGPLDLVVLAETIYCLGWLYPFFDIGLFAMELAAALTPGGRLLLANTFGAERDWLMRPCLIHTYRDLFLNVGLERERESIFTGTKDGEDFQVLVTLFRRGEPRAEG